MFKYNPAIEGIELIYILVSTIMFVLILMLYIIRVWSMSGRNNKNIQKKVEKKLKE